MEPLLCLQQETARPVPELLEPAWRNSSTLSFCSSPCAAPQSRHRPAASATPQHQHSTMAALWRRLGVDSSSALYLNYTSLFSRITSYFPGVSAQLLPVYPKDASLAPGNSPQPRPYLPRPRPSLPQPQLSTSATPLSTSRRRVCCFPGPEPDTIFLHCSLTFFIHLHNSDRNS